VSYWYAFKLLADEGDEVLCPRPSYPLFDYIAALCGVSLIPYPLEEGRGWAMDLERVESSISTRTRAIVVISPHNPTGRVAAAQELEALRDLARRHDLAILSDEVFSEFLLDGPPPPRAASGDAPLVLTLNGFSKMFALPGMKLGWMAVTGEDHAVRQAMRALELISDTFLPVNEIVQEAAPEIFARGGDFQASYAAEIRRRWDTVRGFLDRPGGWRYTAPGGGFYVTLRIEREEEPAAHAVLKEVHALAHPGYFYDIAPHHLVFSYILEPDRAREIFPRLLEVLSRP
jgi:aspartate/methionine/tyrosine aminotransferase